MIRAVFLDVDGTLVGPSQEVSPRVQTAVARARDRGVEVVVCTGRTRPYMVHVADQLGPRGYAVVANGGVALHLGTGEVICRNLLPVATALLALRGFVAAGLHPQAFEDGVDGIRILYHPEFPVDIFDQERQKPWPKLLDRLPFEPVTIASFGPEERVRPVADRMAANPLCGTFIQQAGTHAGWCVEVHHRDSGKCNALQRVIERLGIRREEVLAIGDHVNDVEMLRFAGVGVAMGNALPAAKDAADWVTGTLDEDGVAQAIDRFIIGDP